MRQCRLCDVDLTDGYASDYCADCRNFNKYNRKLLLEHMRQRELEAEGRFESESEARATELRVARASRLSRIAASRGEQDKKADEKDKKGKGYK